MQVLEAADHQAPDFRIGTAGIIGAEIDIAGFIGCQPNLLIKPRPSFCRDFSLQRVANLMLRLRAEFDRDQFLGARAQTSADVVAGDYEVGALFVDAADEEMDMGVIRVPVIDGYPIEPRAEIGLHLFGKVAGESPEVGHVASIFGRDDDPKMMAVVLAPIRESRAIGTVAAGVKHLGPLPAPGHAIALQV
jgi:hypothetical protein